MPGSPAVTDLVRIVPIGQALNNKTAIESTHTMPITDIKEDINELKKLLLDNTERLRLLETAVLSNSIKQEEINKMVVKHEIALYGDGENGNRRGLQYRFNKIEDEVSRASAGIARGLWAVALSIATGIGLWVWEVFKSGLVK